VAVLPDTQYLFDADSGDPAPLLEPFRCLIAERYVFAWFSGSSANRIGR
jgi:hypothetical protein